MPFSRKQIFTIFSLLLACGRADAQYLDDRKPLPSHELSIGGTFGMSDLWGDIGTSKAKDHYTNGVYFEQPHYMGGLFVRYSVTPWLAGRFALNAGTLYATDEYNKKAANKVTDDRYGNLDYLLYARNQDARTNIMEALLYMEVTPFHMLPGAGISRWRLQPILMAGIGAFHFDPQTRYTAPDGSSTWVKTHDLHLEGEGLSYDGAPKGYKRTQMNVPLGGGLRYDVSPSVSIGLEYMVRLTFTDYLDGVSNNYVDPAIFDRYLNYSDAVIARQVYDKTYQIDPNLKSNPGDIRGTPKHNDAYSTWSLSLSIRLPKRQAPSYY